MILVAGRCVRCRKLHELLFVHLPNLNNLTMRLNIIIISISHLEQDQTA